MVADPTRTAAPESGSGAGDRAGGDAAPLALFPLHAVLLPGAAMGVRVFEPRYLELVSDCGRHGRGFGVCLILDGEETGAPALPATTGTEALIEDFGLGEEGLLTLRIRGARRFRVQQVQVCDSGLQRADVHWCAPDSPQPVSPEHGLLVTLLERLLDQVGGEHAKAPRACFDDAAWVGWRLAELLPLQPGQRLQLLELDDPDRRLDHLVMLLPDV
ncbi:MAG: LON peptidase substrate-binding domain-containing protein [Pseudomonadota bacterium]|nr:LON peptidase substrate-binding domain-containing protein [Pseudomonadota bacterium]